VLIGSAHLSTNGQQARRAGATRRLSGITARKMAGYTRPTRCRLIDANGTLEEVHATILTIMGLPRHPGESRGPVSPLGTSS